MASKSVASIPLQAIQFSRPRGPTSIARLEFALSTFSYKPNFPFSLSVYGSLIAPFVQHNALQSSPSFLSDFKNVLAKGPRAAPEDPALHDYLTKKSWKKIDISRLIPNSTASTRYFRILGHYKNAQLTGNVEVAQETDTQNVEPWLYALLDTDDGNASLNLKIFTQEEPWLVTEAGRWVHDKSKSMLKDLGEGEGDPATGTSFFATTQFFQTIIEHLAPLKRTINIECSQLYTGAVERIAARMRLRPTVKRNAPFARFVLFPETIQQKKNFYEELRAAERNSEHEIGNLYRSDLKELGLPYSEEYYKKSLMLTAASRVRHATGGRSPIDACVLCNSDLSINAPYVSSGVHLEDRPQLPHVLIQHATRLIHTALTSAPPPEPRPEGDPPSEEGFRRPSWKELQELHGRVSATDDASEGARGLNWREVIGGHLAVINPQQLPLHARVPAADETSKRIFRDLGWKEVVGGMVEIVLDDWEMRDEEEFRKDQWFRRTKGLLEMPNQDGDGDEAVIRAERRGTKGDRRRPTRSESGVSRKERTDAGDRDAKPGRGDMLAAFTNPLNVRTAARKSHRG